MTRPGVVYEFIRILLDEDWLTRFIAVVFLLTAALSVWMWMGLVVILWQMLA